MFPKLKENLTLGLLNKHKDGKLKEKEINVAVRCGAAAPSSPAL